MSKRNLVKFLCMVHIEFETNTLPPEDGILFGTIATLLFSSGGENISSWILNILIHAKTFPARCRHHVRSASERLRFRTSPLCHGEQSHLAGPIYHAVSIGLDILSTSSKGESILQITRIISSSHMQIVVRTKL